MGALSIPGLTVSQLMAMRHFLSPAEYAQLTPEQLAALGLGGPQGAPTDFGGRVLPNPDGIQPQLDTFRPDTRLPDGVAFNKQGGPASMDTSNGLNAEVIPPAMQTIQSTTTGQPMALPPGATLEAQPAQMALPPGATLETSGKQEPSFWDRFKKPASPEDETLQREVSAVGSALNPKNLVSAIHAAISEPPTAEEKAQFGGDVEGPKRIGLALHRLSTAPAEYAAKWYKDAAEGKHGDLSSVESQILDVAPEAVGQGAGTVLAGKALENGAQAAKATAQDMTPSKAAAPVRAVIRTTNAALENYPKSVGTTLGGAVGLRLGGIHGAELGGFIGGPLGQELLPRVQLPGENLGLPETVQGGPATAPPYQPPTPIRPTYQPPISRAAVQAQLEKALGASESPVKPGQPIAQKPAGNTVPAAASDIPEGHTAVSSSALKSYKYDPVTKEFESVTNGGQHYVYGDVSPEEVSKFENADSKGRAWMEIRQNPLVAKVVNGQRVAVKPTGMAAIEPPQYVYRARPIGEEGIQPGSHAQATSSLTEAKQYAQIGQQQPGAEGEVVRVDLSKLKPGDYIIKQHPNGSKWVQFTRPLTENEIEGLPGEGATQGSGVKPVKVNQ